MLDDNRMTYKSRNILLVITGAIICYFLYKYHHVLNKYSLYEPCTLELNDADRKFSKNRLVNKLLIDYRTDLARRFQRAVDLKLPATHPDLVALALDMMDAPSRHLTKYSNQLMHTPQSSYVYSLLEKSEGFFIECGAMDGERSSNTMYLEQKYGWTGLLIEADPYLYTQLLGKNRHAWSINACLSPSEHAQWLTFAEDKGQRGMVINNISKKPDFLKGPERRTPCLPLESLLLALNRTTVDFFSLDIEGGEMAILPSIPHNKLDINVWTIEYDKVGIKPLQHFMERSGYKKVNKIDHSNIKIMLFAHDLVFVKN